MKTFLLLLIFLVSCAEAPRRGPASIDTDYRYGEIEKSNSSVKLFPPELEDDIFHYYFYIELKDAHNKFVDIDEAEIELKKSGTKNIPFKLSRQLCGRYYIKVDTKKELEQGKVDFYARGEVLREQFKFSLAKIDKTKTKVKMISNRKHRVKFQLSLVDSRGKGVEIPTVPEIIVEPGSAGEVENMVHVKEGVWEFTVHYPEHNVIMYINVRAHGVYLEKLYRFQHVEK